MKRITLTTAYLTVLSTLVFAQLPGSPSTATGKPPVIAPNTQAPGPSAQQSDEFAPLTNLPFFPGGKQALETYLSDLDLYPLSARETQIEGAVRVLFRVLPNGQLNEVRVVRSHGPLLDQAALRAVALMPRWYPAHRAGMAVSHLVELLVTFRLD
ncbi:energy transducer TonB [Spirosoma arcticum]